jgi:hypothetical protein
MSLERTNRIFIKNTINQDKEKQKLYINFRTAFTIKNNGLRLS